MAQHSLVGEKVDVLVGKIHRGFDIHAQPRDLLHQGVHALGKLAAQTAVGCTRRSRAAGIDQVGNGFRLAEVEFVVVKSALGELTGPGRPCTQFQHAGQQLIHDHGAAVAMQLQHMLAGVGGWRGEVQRQTLIDG